MGDEQDGHPRAAQSRHDAEEAADLVRRERGGRLVHDQHAHAQGERLGDLDGLLLGQGQATCRELHVEPDTKPRKNRFGIPLHGPVVDDASPIAMADEDVLGDREIRKDHGFLVDRRDPKRLRLERAADPNRAAIDEGLARVRLLDPGHDLDEGRLARAVLPEEGVDLAGEEGQRDVVERLGRAEALGDAPDLDDRGG